MHLMHLTKICKKAWSVAELSIYKHCSSPSRVLTGDASRLTFTAAIPLPVVFLNACQLWMIIRSSDGQYPLLLFRLIEADTYKSYNILAVEFSILLAPAVSSRLLRSAASYIYIHMS